MLVDLVPVFVSSRAYLRMGRIHEKKKNVETHGMNIDLQNYNGEMHTFLSARCYAAVYRLHSDGDMHENERMGDPQEGK
jgi:hypothetical protein